METTICGIKDSTGGYTGIESSVDGYKIYCEEDEDGMFVIECKDLPGCISQGNNYEEAIHNIKEAIELYLEANKS